VLSIRGLCDVLINRPEEAHWRWCIVVCDLEPSRLRKPWPAFGRSATKKIDTPLRNKKMCGSCQCSDISSMGSSIESVLILLRTRNEKRPRNFAGDAAYAEAQWTNSEHTSYVLWLYSHCSAAVRIAMPVSVCCSKCGISLQVCVDVRKLHCLLHWKVKSIYFSTGCF